MTTQPRRFQYVRPWLYPKQAAAVFAPARIVIIEATTKCGKTVACLVWLVECALRGRPGDQFWWVAPVSMQARMAFDRLQRFLPRGTYTAHSGRLTITLPNHTTLCFKSADHPDTLYGEDVRAVVIDEATRCKEATWHAVRSTVTATHGDVRIIGNVRGRRNWVYRLARQAEAGAPDMAYARLTADDAVQAGIFDAAELASAQHVLPPQVFRELYYAEASDDQGNPFGFDAIAGCVGPLSDGEPYVWGWDLGEIHDWTVGIALDAHGAVCRLVRFQRPWPETKTSIEQCIGATPALIDSSGVGGPVVEQLQRVEDTSVQGFNFSSLSKQQLMERLVMAIQQKRIRIPDGLLVLELQAYEYEYTRTGVRYAAAEGMHDDAVCGLALAVKHYAWQTQRSPELVIYGEHDYRDLADQQGDSFERYVIQHRCWFPGDC